MPSGGVASGVASVLAESGTAAAGRAIAYETAVFDGAAAGVASVDRSLFLAWAKPQGDSAAPDAFTGVSLAKLTGVRILIDDEDFTPYIASPVAFDENEDTPGKSATFELAHPRVAWNHPDTISLGTRSIVIVGSCGSPGREKEWTIFRGTVKAAPNDDAILPHAQFTAISSLTEALAQPVCWSLPALSKKPRWTFASEIAAFYGITLVGAHGGKPMMKPKEINGDLTVGQVMAFLAELEDGGLIENDDGALEFVPPSRTLGGEKPGEFAPVFRFGPADGISSPAPREEPPDPAFTDIVVAGARVSEESTLPPVTKTKIDGSPQSGVVIETTTYGDAVVRQVVSEWGVVAADAVAPGVPYLQVTKRTTVENVYAPHTADEDARASTALLSRTTTTEELGGIPVSRTGGGGYVWASGGRYSTSFATLLVTSISRETFRYEGCFLAAALKVTSAYYSQLGFGGDYHFYEDGALRLDAGYLFQPILAELALYKTTDDTRSVTTYTDRWYVSGTVSAATEESLDPGPLVFTLFPRETPGGGFSSSIGAGLSLTALPTGGGSSVDSSLEIWTKSGSSVFHVKSQSSIDPSTQAQPASYDYMDALPDLPRGSEDESSFSQIPFTVAVRLSGDVPYASKEESLNDGSGNAINAFIEDEEDAAVVAWSRLRRQFSAIEQREGLLLPFVRPRDPVSAADPARSLILTGVLEAYNKPRLHPKREPDSARAYVAGIRRLAGGPSGENWQENRLRVPYAFIRVEVKPKKVTF
jgi:hypothetical protein